MCRVIIQCFQDVERTETNTRLDELRTTRDRIYDAIDTKTIIGVILRSARSLLFFLL